jgi:phage gpG-like protein
MPAHNTQVGISIDASQAIAKMGRVQAILQVRDILETIGQSQLRWIGLNIQEAGNVAGGQPWQRMAPVTIKRRPLRRSPSHFSSPYQTLLQQSVNAEVLKEAEVNEAAASVSVGTNAQYALYHHFGARRGRWVLPARPLLPSVTHARKLALDVVNAIVTQLTAAGR